MPHSSGGGFHGGGFHGSHSGGFRSGNSNSGTRLGSHRVIHPHYFPGARRYVSYADKEAHYVYSDHDITGKTFRRYLIVYWIVLAAILSAMLVVLLTGRKPPAKLYAMIEGNAMVKDDLELFDEKQETDLLEVLDAFYEKTGIAPCVMTVSNNKWKNNYAELEQYAYVTYINHFLADETHWLILYSQPQQVEEGEYIEWYWEGMQGNDTDDILNRKVTDQFNSVLYKNLSEPETYTVAGAIQNAFEEIMPMLMQPGFYEVGSVQMRALILVLGFFLFYGTGIVFSKKPESGYQDYIQCPPEAEVEEGVCYHCDGTYIVGTVQRCPHCGTLIRDKEGL